MRGSKKETFGEIAQTIGKNKNEVKKDENPPCIKPVTRKGLRTNQLDAPTNFMILISSRLVKMARRTVLKATNTATKESTSTIASPMDFTPETIAERRSMTF